MFSPPVTGRQADRTSTHPILNDGLTARSSDVPFDINTPEVNYAALEMHRSAVVFDVPATFDPVRRNEDWQKRAVFHFTEARV